MSIRNHLSYSANQMTRKLGDGAVISINPANVLYDVANIKTRKAKNIGVILDRLRLISKDTKNCNLFYRNRFIISDEDFTIDKMCSETDRYKLVHDYVKNKQNFTNSAWYSNLVSELHENGVCRYKNKIFKTDSEIREFFENYLAPICNSMSARGYDQNLATDKCKCYVTRDGKLAKGENGRHRLTFAQILGVDQFPLTVFGVHEEWFATNVGNAMDFSKLKKEIKKLEAMYR